jgi:DNA adenine methylase
MTDVTRPALRYHGAKFRLAPWLLQFFPPHGCYVEAFGGAAGVLLRKPRTYAEVYNDLDGEVVNFFRVLRDPALRADLVRACQLTPYAREEFDCSYEPTDDPLERARRTAVRSAMGFGSASVTSSSTGFRTDTRRKHGTAQHVWSDYPANVAMVGERFVGVLVENRPAVDVMQQHDGPDTLHFVDPPYVRSTRKIGGGGYGRCYRHEMSDEQHIKLLDALVGLDGMVVLSGYDSDLYAERLATWERHETKARISSGRGTGLRTEVAWLNPACSAALEQSRGGLFADIGVAA